MKILIIILTFISTAALGQKKTRDPFKKNDLRLDLKLPHLNYMSVQPEGRFRDQKIGFNGYGIGLEYNYKEKKFVEASLTYVLTFELPFPAPVDREYNKAISSPYFSLTDNYSIKRFTLAYGINYSSNNWLEWNRNFDTIGLPTTSRTSYSNKTLGMTLNSYYRVGKSLNVGIIYRPTLLKVNKKVEFLDEHLISLELNWRIRLTKNRDGFNSVE